MIEGRYTVYKDGKVIDVVPLENSFDSIRQRIQDLENENSRLEEKIKELSDEKFVDKKIQSLTRELKEEREDSLRGFPITKEESEKIHQWQKKHSEECPFISISAIGGNFTFNFTPTSIGTFGVCKCSCGEKFVFQEAY